MKQIYVKNLRDFIAKPWRFVGLIASISLGIGIFGASELALDSLIKITESIYTDTQFADLELVFLPEDKKNIPDVSDIPGIEDIEYRLILPGTITKKDKSSLTGVLVLSEEVPNLNSLKITDGKMYQKNGREVVIEQSLNKFNQFSKYDSIQIKIGEKVIKEKISGIAISPEYLCMSSNPNFANPEKGTLGVIFGDISHYSEALGFTLVNNIIVKYTPNADKGETKRLILDKLISLRIDKVSTKTNQFSHQQFTFYHSLLKDCADFLVSALLLLSAIVFLLICMRYFKELRKEIGALLAIGYSPGRIILSQISTAIIIGFICGISSCIVASITLPVLTNVVTEFLGLPIVRNYFDYYTFVKCISISILISIITFFIPLASQLRQSPNQIIRESSSTKIRFALLISIISKRIRFKSTGFTIGLRNLLRKPAMACFSILVISCTIGLSIGYALSLDSLYKGMNVSLEQEQWDICTDFMFPAFSEDLELLKKNPSIEKISPYFRGTVEVGYGNDFVDSRILGFIPADSMRKTHLFKGRLFEPERNECVLSRDIARSLKVSLEDMVAIKYQDKIDSLKVVGITADNNPQQILTDLDKARFINGFESRSSGAYLNFKNNKEGVVKDLNIIAKITTFNHLKSVMKKNLDDFMVVIYIIWIYSLIMVIVFLIMFVNLSIEERKSEYAMLLSLGYSNKSISKIIFSEIFTQVVLSVFVSIPMGIAIASYINHRLTDLFIQCFFEYRLRDFLFPIGAAMISVIISGVLSTMNILRMNVVSILRARDIN